MNNFISPTNEPLCQIGAFNAMNDSVQSLINNVNSSPVEELTMQELVTTNILSAIKFNKCPFDIGYEEVEDIVIDEEFEDSWGHIPSSNILQSVDILSDMPTEDFRTLLLRSVFDEDMTENQVEEALKFIGSFDLNKLKDSTVESLLERTRR